MLEPAFFDTNVLLYAYSTAPEDRSKREIACELMMRHKPALSGQILQEFISAALQKPLLGIEEAQIDEFLAATEDWKIEPIDRDVIIAAVALRRRYSLSHWDSAVVAAAHGTGCRHLYSEDLQDGFRLDHLTIVNPFAS